MLLSLALIVPVAFALVGSPVARAPVTNTKVYAAFGPNIIQNSLRSGGPGIYLLCYVDWYPGCANGLPHDMMWFGTYDYLAVSPAGSGNLDYWKLPDVPANGTTMEPGAGKWADTHTRTMLNGGALTQVDTENERVTFTGSRVGGATYTLTLDYYTLPAERTIRVLVNVTNTAAQPFDFGFYHSEDVDAASWPGANLDVNGDGNDAFVDPGPGCIFVCDAANGANLGPGDPGDQWDERILPYSGGAWWTNWATSGLWTSGWTGPALGYVTVLDGSGKDVYDQTVTPAVAGSDGRPDHYSGLFSFESGIDWYLGRWDGAVYGPGVIVTDPQVVQYGCFTNPPLRLLDQYYSWEDVFECNNQYWDGIGNDLHDNDNGVGLLKNLGTIAAGATRSLTFYIGEPPLGPDIAIANSDLSVWPHPGSTVVGTTQLLNATVHSGGTLDVGNDFPVSFYKDNPDTDNNGVIDAGASLIGTVTVPAGSSPLPPGSSYTASLSWTPTVADIGQFTIYAAADYQASLPFLDGTVNEVDQPFYEITNNKAFYDTASVPPGPIPLRTATPPDYEVHPVPVPPRPQPPRELVTAVSGPDINVSWLPPIGGGADYYILYRGTTPRSLDFVTPIGQTVGPLTNFSDPGAASMPEAYYVARSFNTTLSEASSTSNTAGVFMVPFEPGLNSFSLPLQPFTATDTAALYAELGSIDLQYMDAGGAWRVFPGAPSVPVGVGQGYLANFAAATNHTFVGYPGSMISYEGGTYGFTAAEAASLWATVTPAGDVVLDWVEPASPLIAYCVFRSPTRPGFHDGTAIMLGCTSGGPTDTTWTDPGAAAVPGEWYYMVFPPAGTPFGTGTTTYSVGVWTAAYSGAHALGLPLRPASNQSVDWYTADLPNVLGMDWFSAGNWTPHFQEMPAGVYDSLLLQGQGAQIQVAAPGRYTFIGS